MVKNIPMYNKPNVGKDGRFKESKRWPVNYPRLADLPPHDLYLTVNNVATRMGLSQATVNSHIKNGDLPATKVKFPRGVEGFRYVITETDYNAFASNFKKWAH